MVIVVTSHATDYMWAEVKVEGPGNQRVKENLLIKFLSNAEGLGLTYVDYTTEVQPSAKIQVPTGYPPNRRAVHAEQLKLLMLRVGDYKAWCTYCGARAPLDCGYCEQCDIGRSWTCSGACRAHLHSRPCVGCNACAHDCQCPKCAHCGRKMPGETPFEDCGHCRQCCRCGAIIRQTESYELTHVPRILTMEKFKCARTVGVEWEFNNGHGAALAKWCQKWNSGTHSDGSCGWEMVTTPIAGDAIADCLGDLGKAFAKSKAVADERCGIHVHVDAHDLKWRDMYHLLEVYAKLEPLFYVLGGQQRAQNSFCHPCGDNYLKALTSAEYRKQLGCVNAGGEDFEDFKGAIIQVCASRTRSSMRSGVGKKDGGRYKGLNLAPWLAGRRRRGANAFMVNIVSHAICGKEPGHNKSCTKGVPMSVNSHGPVLGSTDCTVEFRLHENSLDGDRIIGWAQLLALFVEWSSKATRKDIDALPKNPIKALIVIAPGHRKWLAARLREWRKKYRRTQRISLKKGLV